MDAISDLWHLDQRFARDTLLEDPDNALMLQRGHLPRTAEKPLAPLVLAAIGPGQASLLRHSAHAVDQVL